MARLDLVATDGQTPRTTPRRHAIDGALRNFDPPAMQVSRATIHAVRVVEASGPVEADAP